jgi:septal ring factor EnvC (AmiA/AmiB activator)
MAATPTGKGLTFEKVWAAIQATNEQIKETDRIVKENAQQIAQQMKETAQQMKETDKQMKETGKQMKETDKRIGAITNRFGEILEYMVVPNLVKKFAELGFTFTKANRTEITDREHNIIMEIDALLENGDTVMAVEIKSKPSGEDIDEHIERMEKLRKYADLHNDRRKYLAAMAGAVFSGSRKTYALKKGFYVIEPSGDTFNITVPSGSYYPHVW